MITGVAIVPSPPLLARVLTGRSVVLPELREACSVAVGRLVATGADVVAVVGAGPQTAAWDPEGRLDVAAWGPLLAAGGRSKPGLPLALGIGAGLLDEAGYRGPRAAQAVDPGSSSADCVALGAWLAGIAPRVALLVVGDGSARCTPAAPGYFDERAEAFNASARASVRDGDMAALAALDAGLGAELMATGRAAWQVLAGAVLAGETGFAGEGGLSRPTPGDVLYADAPLGVFYLVAVLDL